MKQSNKKRLIKISGVLLLLAVLFIVGTLAFFHSVDETTNTFTSGDVHIILKEPDYPGFFLVFSACMPNLLRPERKKNLKHIRNDIWKIISFKAHLFMI